MSRWYAARVGGVAVATLVLVASCKLNDLERDLRSAGELGTVSGRVTAEVWSDEPVRIVVLRVPEDEHGPYRVVRARTRERPGAFAETLPPGEYLVVAYLDADRDERLDEDELAAYTQPAIFVAAGSQIVVDLDPRGPVDRSSADERGLEREPSVETGVVVPLDDPRFGPERGEAGVWRPYATAEAHPPLLAFLEPFDEARTPVVFVHGMSGYAQEFAPLVERLDRRRFQVWVFQYPSGLPLSVVSAALHRQLAKLRVRHGLSRVCMVAHSMGGLVARGALRLRRADPPLVPVLVTLASPLGGMPAAESGVQFAPVVVPAWRDLVPGSPFLSSLFRDPLRPESEHFLLVAYLGDGGSDGVVPLASQLRPEAQNEAVVMRAYRTSHSGILEDDGAAAQVERALDHCRGDRPDASLRAPM